MQRSRISKERKQRTYQAVWKQLRGSSSRTVVLTLLDECFVPRIKRMVSKEKDMDVGFKLANEVECLRLSFNWSSSSRELTIRLVSKFGLADIIG